MNHQKHYNKLMERAPKVKPKEGYFERHRIVPGCMGGKYVAGNVAWLTPEEHYVAHQLLVKMYPNNSKLVYAVNMMCVSGKNQQRNNKLYGWVRRKLSSNAKKRTGSKNGMFGLRYINNGEISILISSKEKIPSNFSLGRINVFTEKQKLMMRKIRDKKYCIICSIEIPYNKKHCLSCLSKVKSLAGKRNYKFSDEMIIESLIDNKLDVLKVRNQLKTTHGYTTTRIKKLKNALVSSDTSNIV